MCEIWIFSKTAAKSADIPWIIMFWQDPITNSGCLTWNTESQFSLCWLSILSFIHRVVGRTGDVVSVVLVRQSDGRLDFSRKGSICVFLYFVVSVLLEIPGEFRRGVWTGSESWAGYSDRLLLLQLTWDFNSGAQRRICGLKPNILYTKEYSKCYRCRSEGVFEGQY